MPQSARIRIHYFTDVLCVWAYLAQIRLDELEKHFGNELDISYHYIPVFGCTDDRIGEGWKERGGYEAFNRHTHEVCKAYPYVNLHKDIWKVNAPKTSASCHMFLKSLQLLETKGIISSEKQDAYNGRTIFEEANWRVRLAFFQDAQDVGKMETQLEIARALNLPEATVVEQMQNGEAMAELCRDIELRDEYKVEGSPTYILNEGRQKLYGNVGYRIIEANVHEIINMPFSQASWC
ncbi:MAG: DsbA family protein [Gammaproteobacteria bacterium]|nr:DsbA family protein [Gammaproteobacteria bacterium]